LFGTGPEEIQAACHAISTRQRFGQVARDFFANLVSRSIRYLTDKELSNYVGTGDALASSEQVLQFQEALERHCAETSKIVEEFAAGGSSKQTWDTTKDTPESAAAGSTAYALQKIKMDPGEGEP